MRQEGSPPQQGGRHRQRRSMRLEGGPDIARIPVPEMLGLSSDEKIATIEAMMRLLA
jgi:hypothetical protein